MAETKKATYIVSNAYTALGDSNLEPGQRVLVDEDNTAHKFLSAQIESGNPDYAHLSLVEVDHKAEAAQEEELKEMRAKAEKIAAEARNEQLQGAQEQQDKQAQLEADAQEAGQPGATEGTDFPPQDEEAVKIAEQSGAGQRASTQEDVVEESSPKRGRRSSRS